MYVQDAPMAFTLPLVRSLALIHSGCNIVKFNFVYRLNSTRKLSNEKNHGVQTASTGCESSFIERFDTRANTLERQILKRRKKTPTQKRNNKQSKYQMKKTQRTVFYLIPFFRSKDNEKKKELSEEAKRKKSIKKKNEQKHTHRNSENN